MNVDAVAVSFVVFPLAFVHVTVSVPEFSGSVSFVLAPFAFIFSAIGPNLDTRSMSHSVFEVAFIDSSIFKNKLINELETLRLGCCLKVGK